MDMNGLLTIGEFSRITHLSVKTLRRYHESGLLEPASVDDFSGYRYYDTHQVATAQIISRFRSMQMPEREVRAIVTTPDPDARARLITEHLTRLERQLDDTRSAVTALRRLLDPTPPTIEVRRILTERCSLAAVSEVVDASEALVWYSEAMAEIDATVSDVTGPPGGLYDNELFTEGRGVMTVYVPTSDAPSLNRIRPMTLHPKELAVTIHHGPHDDIDVTYGALGVYVETNGLAIAGPVREVYVVGPRDTDNSTLWRTEIGWPVFTATSTAP